MNSLAPAPKARWLTVPLLLLVLAGCPPQRTSDPMTGAPTPRAAVERFLAAVRAQDLQAMSVIWGTRDGPARDEFERSQLEKRELIMMCFFDHESYRIVTEAPGQAGSRVLQVELTKGPYRVATNFYAVPGPSDRWYVENADLEPVEALCKEPPVG